MTRIGILGTGMVGRTLGTRLAALGHEVVMGARQAGHPGARSWARETGGGAGDFAEAAAHGELLVNATAGAGSCAALRQAGEENLAGKVVLDTSNPLDFGAGFPPSLRPVNTDSLGEQLQRAFPAARIVKTLNTVLASVMVEPDELPEPHDVFVAGEDADAKRVTRDLLVELGWSPEHVIDLGGIRASRGTEMYIALWLALDASFQTGNFNIRVVRH
ncbi:NAD(P)-binding domain-containing protein [Streptomyces sp. V4-01]|uniref:NAD(P)-binding domain-containing protein n=1 Tax=Actinacidiphila polyblastidii TaxID=3110430 RepID=A0ABU7PIJ6_9ACTN|nr:NAD(P)-binding domain-containing protein [Streptomyces sp. V4-01]